ncbi:MAG: hypothetical protein MUC79_15835, partial [Thiobacillaceae bacterium]|nr:hypothetical protein [Thiobacillaceae bacterium]
MDKVGAWIDKNPELATTLLMVAGVTAGLMVVFGGLITALAGIVGSLAVLWVSLKVVAGPFAALWRFGGLLVRVFGALGWVVKLLAVALWKDIATKAIPAVLAGLRLLWGALLANPVAVVIGLIAGAIYVFTH